MIKDIQEFNQLFQLYQKNDRYNLYIHDFPKDEFIQRFFNDEVEDLYLEYFDLDTRLDKKITNYRANFSDFFSIDNLASIQLKSTSGYFYAHDFYFMTENDTFIFNYIHRNFLSELLDILLSELDCNFISRLKTELLINLEFE
ncbi:MAG: hypothetical protein RR668_06235 [Algoriella sp.]|uniref:hypothetical protein n=2 Tax=Algoriella sp. TaxID=1872434 RepID=UPI002FCB1B6A